MAEEFSYRPKDVSDHKSPSSCSNLVAIKSSHQVILLMDKDLVHFVAEEIHHTSIPYETNQDQEMCRSYIRGALRKTWDQLNYGTPPPLFSELNTLSYVWDKPPSTGDYSVGTLMRSWDITESRPMYVLRHATDPEIQIHSCLLESVAKTKRLTSAHTLQAEKYSALKLLLQEHHQDMTTAASYSRPRGLEEQLAAATSRCNALEAKDTSALEDAANRPDAVKMVDAASQMDKEEAACAASPDVWHVNKLYAAEDMEKGDAAATTDTRKTSEDRKAYTRGSQENLAAVPSDLA
jgi:hypothetical protein